MLMQVRSPNYLGSRIWNRLRTQLGGSILLAVVLPVLSLPAVLPDGGSSSVAGQTASGMTVAVFISVYLLRNISIFPGIRRGYFILPAVLLGFGTVFSAFLFMRLDYSRFLLGSGLIGQLFWLYLADFLSRRESALRIGIVPFGEVHALSSIPDVDWVWLDQPSLGSERFDVIVADLRADLPDEWETFLADTALKGGAVFHVKQLHESITGQVEIEHLSENSLGSLVPFMGYLRLRRVFDIAVAAIVGAALLPFLLAIALLIKMDSPGPAIYRQTRTGYRGKVFTVVKFRTMRHHRHQGDAIEEAMTRDDDDRITRLGRSLRRSRIDELPQIWNILKGEMSWIGPRPEAAALSTWYEAELPFYRYRHIVPPGITGWAQVNQGHVADLEQVNLKLHYDFFYIKNFSPWLDALIVVKTVQTVLTGFGSR